MSTKRKSDMTASGYEVRYDPQALIDQIKKILATQKASIMEKTVKALGLTTVAHKNAEQHSEDYIAGASDQYQEDLRRLTSL